MLHAQSDWNIVKRGYEAHVLGEAPNTFSDPVQALKELKVPGLHLCSDPES